jgi:hypothetical protein
VGTNHLGHFLLANLLKENLAKSTAPPGRLVVTGSPVHDPKSGGGDVGSTATLGDLAGLQAAATPGKPPNLCYAHRTPTVLENSSLGQVLSPVANLLASLLHHRTSLLNPGRNHKLALVSSAECKNLAL